MLGVVVMDTVDRSKHYHQYGNTKEWTGKMIYFNFSSIFGDFFLIFFEEEVSAYLS